MSVSVAPKKASLSSTNHHRNGGGGFFNGGIEIVNGSSSNGNGMHAMYDDFLHMDSYNERNPGER